MSMKTKLERTLVTQVCKGCGRSFRNCRIQKYCSDGCRSKANRLLSHLRYDKLRRAYLESQTLNTGKEAARK